MFDVDKQTLIDLNIFSSDKSENSIFNFFNETKTIGGKKKLHDYLNNPSSNISYISNVRDAIKFFSKIDYFSLNIDKNDLDFIKYYLQQGNYPTKPPSRFTAIESYWKYKIKQTNEYYIIERGIDYIIYLLNNLYNFSLQINDGCPPLIRNYCFKILHVFEDKHFKDILKVKDMKKLKCFSIASFDVYVSLHS